MPTGNVSFETRSGGRAHAAVGLLKISCWVIVTARCPDLFISPISFLLYSRDNKTKWPSGKYRSRFSPSSIDFIRSSPHASALFVRIVRASQRKYAFRLVTAGRATERTGRGPTSKSAVPMFFVPPAAKRSSNDNISAHRESPRIRIVRATLLLFGTRSRVRNRYNIPF